MQATTFRSLVELAESPITVRRTSLREDDAGGPPASGGHAGQKMVFGTWRKVNMSPTEHRVQAMSHHKMGDVHNSHGVAHATLALDAKRRGEPEAAEHHERLAQHHFAMRDAHHKARKAHASIASKAKMHGIADHETIGAEHMTKIGGVPGASAHGDVHAPESDRKLSPEHHAAGKKRHASVSASLSKMADLRAPA